MNIARRKDLHPSTATECRFGVAIADFALTMLAPVDPQLVAHPSQSWYAITLPIVIVIEMIDDEIGNVKNVKVESRIAKVPRGLDLASIGTNSVLQSVAEYGLVG